MRLPSSELKPLQESMLRAITVVSVHLLVLGMAIGWWGMQWLPQYFRFHANRGFLNPELTTLAQPWFDFLALGEQRLYAVAVLVAVFDLSIVFLLVRSARFQWVVDYWSVLVVMAPLLAVAVSGTLMLDGYWGLQERIAQQKQRGVGQRGRDFRNLVGNWTLIAKEKDGLREVLEHTDEVLIISDDGYKWLSNKGECLGSWNVYSSSDQNEMSFVPNEVTDNAWGGQGYYRVTETRLALHLVNEPGFFDLNHFDSRTGGELWIFKRK